MPPFPAYISVMFASFDPHSNAIRRGESLRFLSMVICGIYLCSASY